MSTRPKPSLDGEEIAIVLVGDFNPKIFQPAWFALENLIRVSEAEHAEVEIIHRDVSSFCLDWAVVQVTRDRFLAKTKSLAHRTALRDLVVGTFSRLRHTPTQQLGIHLIHLYRFASDTEWHNFGHLLAPKSPWKNLLQHPGMRSIRMQGVRSDDAGGYIYVSVESNKPGYVSIEVTDHLEAAKDADKNPDQITSYFVEKVETDFDLVLERAAKIIDSLIDRFLEQESFDDGSC